MAIVTAAIVVPIVSGGVSAAVSVATMAADKTFILEGGLGNAIITIEARIIAAGAWAPALIMQRNQSGGDGAMVALTVMASDMRVRTNFLTGSAGAPTVRIAAETST